ncbi:MAG: ACP S-malonyltransferase [Turneriella sp.]|nr:ACP S-malonyltransferase [Turneriella sp.]
MAKLLDQAQSGALRFYLQFGGQGAPYLKEMQKLYSEAGMANYFSVALSAIEAAIRMVENSPVLPLKVDLRRWLEDPASAPADETMAIASISLGLIQATQFAHYEYLHLCGFDRRAMLKATAGATGHSQGLIAATFTALCLEGKAYYDALYIFLQYLFLMGVRAQEVFPFIEATPAEVAKSESLGAKAPAPMVAVLGESHALVEKWVSDFNGVNKKIYVSLYNTPSNRIISGPRSELIAFHERYKSELEARQMKYIYLRSTCPFHCELMQPILEKFRPDIERIGFHFKGSDLKFPVYSFWDGENLQNVGELGLRLTDDLMVKTLYWDKAMAPVKADNTIGAILDFGPGKTSQRLSEETLQGLGHSVPIYAVATPKDLKTLLD